jgi:Protein of unknown function (DUF3754)
VHDSNLKEIIALRYAILGMHILIFYVAALVYARNSFAFHSFTLQQSTNHNGYFFKYQRRTTAQPLIVDTFDCSNGIAVLPQVRGTEVSHKVQNEFKIMRQKRHSHVKIIGTFEKFSKDTATTHTLDQVFEHGSVLLQNSMLNDTTSARQLYKKQVQQSSIEGGDLVCRVIARSDKKLPSIVNDGDDLILNGTITKPSMLLNYKYSKILHQIDDIYHAKAHQQTRQLTKHYLSKSSTENSLQDEDDTFTLHRDKMLKGDGSNCDGDFDSKSVIASSVRRSLEDAGYELLSRRDLDLCEALNAGYLLRLSILPDTSTLDPSILYDMYPEKCDPNTRHLLPEFKSNDDFLFDQRVLVYWRGYSKEVTRGRLLLPKLDYLQASIVQRLFGNVRSLLGRFERNLFISSLTIYRQATACFLYYMRSATEQIPNERIAKRMRKMIRSPYFYSAYKALKGKRIPSVNEMKNATRGENSVFTLSRYGGTKTKFVGSPNPRDALNPFIICEESIDSKGNIVCNENIEECLTNECDDDDINEVQANGLTRVQRVNQRMYESLNKFEIRCPYDKNIAASSPTSTAHQEQPMQLLERVSISNLVDVFTKEGRRNLLKTMFSKSELVEPTYEEVVVIWRPLNVETEKTKPKMPKFVPPKILYEIADMFDLQDVLPPPASVVTKETIETAKASTSIPPIEIRTFEGVPMANLPAVLPKTKLIFRPADAFVFDLISVLSFAAIIGSLRFDNPKLDLIAIVSVGLWLVRTVLRYSNKLARYDLLVKTFLTSKITQRNVGALRYILNEAGLQRAKRATLVHMWLNDIYVNKNDNIIRRSGLFGSNLLLRSQLIQNGQNELHRMMNTMKRTPVDVDAALNDLEELQLVRRFDSTGQLLDVVPTTSTFRSDDETTVSQTLQQTWLSIFNAANADKSNRTGIKSSKR